uniref:Uncharacterized protein n=1 Tax=Neobodo designis TaxID=312471 RepID=A0A7S1R2X0_NEODS|mmetsp:Transcript_7573/g.23628  ORF Transcript_7573/g.23628 Transcript_7573/m.23628 type:complete len:237 (+) Transcript_7573:79-789(+)
MPSRTRRQSALAAAAAAPSAPDAVAPAASGVVDDRNGSASRAASEGASKRKNQQAKRTKAKRAVASGSMAIVPPPTTATDDAAQSPEVPAVDDQPVDPETMAILQSLPTGPSGEVARRSFATSRPLLHTVRDACALRNGEALTDTVPGATFGRPAQVDQVQRLPAAVRDARPFLAADSPITDAFIDVNTGELLLRWHVPSSTLVAPHGQMITTIDEAARTHPQVLIDFLLASTVFE